MPFLHAVAPLIGLAALAAAAGYSILTLVGVIAWRGVRAGAKSPQHQPAVTVLQPLCGAEHGLYEHLRCICKQDYPDFQIVLGVQDAADPALEVVARLMRQFPSLPIDVVVNPEQHGNNRKVSNLINMVAKARHDVLVMVDSDVRVGPDYLATVTAPLVNRSVGLVTCIYRDVPTRSVWSRLGAMYINEWYMPSVLLARLFGFEGYASGQTLCLRRDTMQAIGGLLSLANHLADDYRLGELVRGLGLRVVMSPYPVQAEHDEAGADSLIRHELRWMQTIRVLRPGSFRLLFLSFSLPLAILGIALAGAATAVATVAWNLFCVTLAARLTLHFGHRLGRGERLLSDVWLLPLRDMLTCAVWCGCFFTSRVVWRGRQFDVDADGVLHEP